MHIPIIFIPHRVSQKKLRNLFVDVEFHLSVSAGVEPCASSTSF